MMMSTFLCCDSTHVHWLSHCMCIVLYVCEVLFVVASVCCDVCKGVFIATQLNSTQLNSTDPVEQRTAKSVVFLFMTSWPTNWVNWVIDRWQLFTLWTRRQFDVELSWVELSCVAINGPLTCCDATLQSRLFLSHVTGNAYVTFRIDQH